MNAIQIAGILFGVFIIYVTYLYHKRKEFTQNELLFWSAVSLGVIILSIVPDIVTPIVKGLRFARTFDFVVVMALMFLISIFFYVYGQTKLTSKKLEEVVRKVALDYPKKKK